jgi:RNA polymerase sigma-54 factor
LSDHLLWQLLMLSPTDIEKQVGSLIIGNLNKDGYLQLSVEELSEQSGISIEMVEDVLETMQSFDPVGVCSRDLRECLLLQAKLSKLDDSLVTDIISDHLKNLENKNFKAICKDLKVKLKGRHCGGKCHPGLGTQAGKGIQRRNTPLHHSRYLRVQKRR